MDLSKEYLIWDSTAVPRSYIIDEIEPPKGIEEFKLRKDKPLADQWGSKKGVCTIMDGDPKNPLFADNLINSDRQIVISERLKDALQALKIDNIEYLPVSLKNEKGKTLDLTYYIAHLINLPDCIDIKASEATLWSY
jgi:hypothetical protein